MTLYIATCTCTVHVGCVGEGGKLLVCVEGDLCVEAVIVSVER